MKMGYKKHLSNPLIARVSKMSSPVRAMLQRGI
jgi:hypothetical protein